MGQIKYLYKKKWVLAVLRGIDAISPFKARGLPSQIDRILIVKPDHLGDCLLLTSILPFLGKRYPNASIDLLIQRASEEIFTGNPYISRRFFLDHYLLQRPKRRLWLFIKDYLRVWRQLRKESYDLCLFLRSCGGNLITLGRLIGAKCLIGHETAGFGKWLDIVAVWKEDIHETGHFLEVLAPLGIEPEKLRPQLYPSASDEVIVEQICSAYSLKEFIVIHPFAGDPSKCVDKQKWEQVLQKASCPVVLTGKLSDPIELSPVIDLRGRLTIVQLYLLFRKAKCIYTLDSLASHLAALSERPAYLFYKQERFSLQWRPIGSTELIKC